MSHYPSVTGSNSIPANGLGRCEIGRPLGYGEGRLRQPSVCSRFKASCGFATSPMIPRHPGKERAQRRPQGAFDAVIQPATSTKLALGQRIRRSSRSLLGLENDLFRRESRGIRRFSSGMPKNRQLYHAEHLRKRRQRCQWRCNSSSESKPKRSTRPAGPPGSAATAATAPPSGYGISGRCSADAPSVPPPAGSAPSL